MKARSKIIWVGAAIFALAIACIGPPAPPKAPNRICAIFQQYPNWRNDAERSSRRWGIPVPVMMAIMRHESGFKADARPPRTTCCLFLPGPRPSSAYGYSQALDGTWDMYKRKTGNRWADRDDFADAIDFVGWYCHVSYKECGIRKTDARNLYLAYHEGWAGYRRGTYRRKRYLQSYAGQVAATAARYQSQMAACKRPAARSGRSCLWFF